ncbi:MAG: hypothetical protein JSR17_10575 [Proteobacteria bacterium]|nr:hypothetical protein [Pseudomonadota bacterium]
MIRELSSKFIKKCKTRLYDLWDGAKILAKWSCEIVFMQKPWYLFPVRFFLLIMLILINIGNIEIRFWPRKFKSFEEFYAHVDSIVTTLRENNQKEWADEIHGSLYVSQSFYEMQGELLKVLPYAKRQKFSKELKLTKDINKAISFLKSFSRRVI